MSPRLTHNEQIGWTRGRNFQAGTIIAAGACDEVDRTVQARARRRLRCAHEGRKLDLCLVQRATMGVPAPCVKMLECKT